MSFSLQPLSPWNSRVDDEMRLNMLFPHISALLATVRSCEKLNSLLIFYQLGCFPAKHRETRTAS